jgi:hypothetical protein
MWRRTPFQCLVSLYVDAERLMLLMLLTGCALAPKNRGISFAPLASI